MSDDYTGTVSSSGCITTTDVGMWTAGTLGSYETYTIDPNYYEWKYLKGSVTKIIENKGGDENMRYLYEVILVNPKNDTFYVEQYIARTDTSALMEVYHNSQFYDSVEFDDLKTSCRILMEWKKEKSLKKAIETIKKAVE